jgi:predicted small secreted protein
MKHILSSLVIVLVVAAIVATGCNSTKPATKRVEQHNVKRVKHHIVHVYHHKVKDKKVN